MVERRNNGHSDEQVHILQSIRREALLTDPVYNRCRFVTFLSQSAGRGRKRRPREVQLLVIDDNYAYQVKNGELKGRRSGIGIDVLAMEILTDLPNEERSVDALLRRAIKISS